MTNLDNRDKTGAAACGSQGGRISLPRLFNWGVVGFFLFQLAVGLYVIFHFIGGEAQRLQTERAQCELHFRSQALEAHHSAGLILLGEFSRLPVLIERLDRQIGQDRVRGVMHSLFLLDRGAVFTLQDAGGDAVYVTDRRAEQLVPRGRTFDALSAAASGEVSLVMDRDGGSLWRLAMPVLRGGEPVGLLCAFVPVDPAQAWLSSDGAVGVALLLDGVPVIVSASVPEPVSTYRLDTAYRGVSLEIALHGGEVDRQTRALAAGMVATLGVGALLLMLIIHVVGNKLYIVPTAKLRSMHDELEREVEKRTADLKMRTVQLSIEIRERRESEIEARESGQLVSALLEGIGAAFFILNPRTGHVVKSNSVVHAMFGLSPWQLADRPCAEAFANSAALLEDLLCPRVIRNNTYVEGVARHTNGQSFPVARYLVPMELRGEDHIGVIVLDITERKNLERRLHIAQKLESVGELASGVAHEINTPIQYVGDSVLFVQDAFAEVTKVLAAQAELAEACREAGFRADLVQRIDALGQEADLEFVLDEVPKACERALGGTGRVATIVRAMKNFAHPGDGEKKAVDINAALENTIIVAKNEWKYVAEVVTDFDALPMVQCLPGDINQVFLNILVNAAQAIGDVVGNSGDKGTITIATRRGEGEVIISISDTGTGISPEIRNKIFNPFFTTKEVGKGTGQGLAIVHDIIVERHGGVIDVESEPGRGSTFIIRLPATD
ncbi:PAS domain S-box protein [Pseudodesulfovibrio sp. F-1]|uniref:histidine kinase n=1 Tax=Pseudodesulfovibrio alkaliphilus TaxID=2661613 RepID=A0A7K1KK84_9BACT|nr:ATP-binding protein [Pseudodesulfovibrio alkaliphilus]MUM76440.1 PAS domain S-box protein [Pseudodesulfovibrio alkaliphilus]